MAQRLPGGPDRSPHRPRPRLATAVAAAGLSCAAVGWAGPAHATGPPSAPEITLVPRPGTTLSVDGVPYPGEVVVAPDGSGVAVVNRVGFEDYIAGIAEMPSSWPAAALQAQAVAARTYALWTVLTHPPGPGGGQICASDRCQVYAGLSKTRGPGGANWAAAVRATSGRVLTYRGQVLETVYGAHLGIARAGDARAMAMSQYGALAQADRGRSAAQILEQYYPGAHLGPLPANDEPATISVTLAAPVAGAALGATGPVDVLGPPGRILTTTGGPAGWEATRDGSGVELRPEQAAAGRSAPSAPVPATPAPSGAPGPTAASAGSPVAPAGRVAAAFGPAPRAPRHRAAWAAAALVLLVAVAGATVRVARGRRTLQLTDIPLRRPAGAHYRGAVVGRGRTANG